MRDTVALHIGLDDTDSPQGMCTTYIGSLVLMELAKRGVALADYPYLVRLNPNIPFKTRGNGAVSLHFRCAEDMLEEVSNVVEEVLNRYSEKHGKTDPTAVIVQGSADALRALYKRALTELLPPSHVEKVLSKLRARVLGARKGRGVVGAAASIGAFGLEAYTYELLVYAPPGTSKRLDVLVEDVVELDRLLRPLTFANVDYGSLRALAVPRSGDPVMAGIRSTNPLILSSIARRLVEKWGAQLAVVFKTNQATGCHLSKVKGASELRPYDSAVIRGRVAEPPRTLRGGHVLLRIRDSSGEVVCAVYRETGLQRIARLLKEGDLVEIGGGVQPRRQGLTLNVEYIRVLEAVPSLKLENPLCPRCGRRLKSAGKGKGFKCVSCGYRSASLGKVEVKTPRLLEPGLYLQRPLAYRHLSPPAEVLGSAPLPAPPLLELVAWPIPFKVFKEVEKGQRCFG